MNQLEQLREQCAVTAWNHYMDTCKRLNRAPASYEEFIASSAIRALPLPAVSVLDFGAAPTGETDSSSAIQSAIDYSSLASQAEALREENEKLNALLLATNNDLMNALHDIEKLKEEKKSLQNQVNEFEMKLAKERAK